jgi:O-antigen ligase
VGLNDIKLSLNDPNYFGSWSARITMWINSYHLWVNHPVLGIGLGDFGREMKAYVDVAQPGIDPVHYSYTAHNAYVHTVLETGLVGIAAFLMGVFILPLRSISNNIISYGKNKSSLHRASLIMVLVSFIIFGISTTWIATRAQIAVFLFFTLIFMSYIQASNKSEC